MTLWKRKSKREAPAPPSQAPPALAPIPAPTPSVPTPAPYFPTPPPHTTYQAPPAAPQNPPPYLPPTNIDASITTSTPSSEPVLPPASSPESSTSATTGSEPSDQSQDPTPDSSPRPSTSASTTCTCTCSCSSPPVPTTPPDLKIHSATFGGVQITSSIARLIHPETQSLKLDLSTLHRTLDSGDPAPFKRKTFSLAYQFRPDTTVHLINLAEPDLASSSEPYFQNSDDDIIITISPDSQLHPNTITTTIITSPQQITAPSNDDDDDAEILGVFYGPEKITNPIVITQLSSYFAGQTPQLQNLGNDFFGQDPWFLVEKTWSVFFRFKGGDRGVQVVTGWEGGVLERPWGR
ncbi:hypothetical protein QBC43DRAFT_321779 [Cladorrhinum sp. PSN259]|nr:hypothetical protein QBC43DRAFT_321779 [Cladorrhinum sp. PSN259]